MSEIKNKLMSKIIGDAILLASMQAAIGSVEMSSKFSVTSFAKDQETLQRAADALTSYIIIGTIWTIGTMLILYAKYGNRGLIAALVTNLVMLGWIVISYWQSFKIAVKKYKLKMPLLFTDYDYKVEIEEEDRISKEIKSSEKKSDKKFKEKSGEESSDEEEC